MDSTHSDARHWFQLGKERSAAGALDEAMSAYRKAVELKPDYAEAWSNLGGVLGALGRRDEEIAAYRNGVAANPALAPIWSNLGEALAKSKRHAEAVDACREAVKRDAGFAAAWVNMGNALRELRLPEEAAAAFERALGVDPGAAEAWLGLGNVRQDQKRFDGAREYYERACAADPGLAPAHVNLASLQARSGHTAQAEAGFRRALALDPGLVDAQYGLSLLCLAAGNFEEGWRLYETRWAHSTAPTRRYPRKGDGMLPRPGQRVLVWSEQGVGDEILYGPMAAELAASGAAVTLESDARLAGLFQRTYPELAVIPREDPLEVDLDDFDHVVPAADLGRWLRPTLQAFPNEPRPLQVDEGLRRRFDRDLGGALGARRRIGISWKSANPKWGAEKSLSLPGWLPVLRTPGVAFVDLQYGDTGEERAALASQAGIELHHVPGLDLRDDLEGVAALVAACDLVITTSNVTAHIAGAQRRPLWVLLPFGGARIWYWTADAERTPWYPAARLFPQFRESDWDAPMAAVSQALQTWIESTRGQ